jgi:hypothetical protein
MTKTEALAKIEELQKYVDSIQEEPQTESRLEQMYRYIHFLDGQWAIDTDIWSEHPIDHNRLKAGTAFWQGTPAEQDAEAQRAILRCRYVLENRWKPKQDQEVWLWHSDGSIGSDTFNWSDQWMVRNLNEGYYSPSREAAEKRRDEFMSAFLYVPEGVK